MRSGSTPPMPRQPSATSPRSPATCLPTTPRAPAWGRWTGLTAHFGALVVNLADAVLPGREITLEIDAFCGKLILTVPAGAHVIDEGGALFAKRAVYGRQDPDDADGPVIRLVGEARFSKVAVHRGRYEPYAQWRHWQQ